jgi:transposase-like protein
VILNKPQFREVPFRTEVFERYSRVEKSLRIAIAESYLQGVSTKKVQDVISRFGSENISASEVSRISKKLDEKVKEFFVRPIGGGAFSNDGPLLRLAVCIAMDINEEWKTGILTEED